MEKGKTIKARLTPDEMAILQIDMEREKWQNISGYIRYKLFGNEPSKKIEETIEQGEPKDLAVILEKQIEELNHNLARFNSNNGERHETIPKEIIETTKSYLQIARKIAVKLKITEYGQKQ